MHEKCFVNEDLCYFNYFFIIVVVIIKIILITAICIAEPSFLLSYIHCLCYFTVVKSNYLTTFKL